MAHWRNMTDVRVFCNNTVRLGMVFIYVQAEMASLAAPFYFISQMLGEVGRFGDSDVRKQKSELNWNLVDVCY